MDEIQVLPGTSSESDGNGGKNQEEHAYFKQPVEAPNEVFCHVCKKGADLIGCDVCPKSYHPHCHDPLLNFKNVPQGKWSCQSCKFQRKKVKHMQKPRQKQLVEDSVTGAPATKSPTKMDPLELLIEAARYVDPLQFETPPIKMELPKIMDRAHIFDDPELVKKLEQREKDKMLKSAVPLADLSCAKCEKSCKVAALIECDFCNSYFHVNCLEPPLTELPLGLWMCPLHGENKLDPKILSSASMFQRVALTDKFVPPNDDARGNTLRVVVLKPRSTNSPQFEFKKELSSRALIPGGVRAPYSTSDPLFPIIKEELGIEEHVSGDNQVKQMKDETNKENEKENADIEVKTVSDGSKKGGEEDESTPCDASDTGRIKNEVPTSPIHEETANVHLSPTNIADKAHSNKNDSSVDIREINQIEEAMSLVKKKNSVTKDIIDGSFIIDAEQNLRQLDERLIKNLAYERLRQLADPNVGVPKFPLASELLSPADKERIMRIFTKPPTIPKVSESTMKTRAMLCPIVSKHFYNIKSQEVDPADVRLDASFLNFRPTVSTRFPEAIAMKKQSINVGRGSSNDVNLEVFGQCNFIAPLHATIFFDGFENCFELINYAPHGTRVNNVLFSDNASQAHSASLKEQDKHRDKNQNVGKTVGVKSRESPKKKNHRSSSVEIPKMAAPESTPRVECACLKGAGIRDLKGHSEGSAILNHGTLIKFGCLGFVFSIVDKSTI
ncbi:unnamed protein product [Ceutorhynchus assimilis]|uniref:PHD finger protein 12 n=1 Tax=Ceutorhynchus assimilis TaxID=467358 RepID=A0A9N9MAN7_9CUCU|nr:unnamed protein product [Ceutorhynchus assimilis]